MSYKQLLRNFADKLPYVRSLRSSVNFYESRLPVLPGHFYSPIVDTEEIFEKQKIIFTDSRNLAGVFLNEAEQMKLLEDFKEYYKLLSFSENQVDHKRYYYKYV